MGDRRDFETFTRQGRQTHVPFGPNEATETAVTLVCPGNHTFELKEM